MSSAQPTTNWEGIANSDPAIAAWFAQLTQGRLLPEKMTPAALMKRDMSYDYRSAIESGARPSLQSDGRYHWPSGNYYEIWKAVDHPTVMDEIDARLRQGIPIPDSHKQLLGPTSAQQQDLRKTVAGKEMQGTKHTLSEGVVPYLTQKSLEEMPGGKAVEAVGAAVKKALGHVYPVEGKK